MKNKITLFYLFILLLSTSSMYSHYNKNLSIVTLLALQLNETQKDPKKTEKIDTVSSAKPPTKQDTVKNINKIETKIAPESKTDAGVNRIGISEFSIQIISISFFLVMLFLLYNYFEYLKRQNQRIGYQSIKLIGLVLIFPGICILALVGGDSLMSGETLAALFGTIAGYVLSKEEDSNVDSLKNKIAAISKEKEDLVKKNNEILETDKKLKDEIEKLKKLVPKP